MVTDAKQLTQDLNDATIQGLVDTIIRQALRERASDIHLEPTEDDLIVRFRIDGLLRHVETIPAHLAGLVITRIKIMGDLDIAEKRVPQDGRRAGVFDDRIVDMRISSAPLLHGEKVVLRLLPQDSSFDKLDDLGFTGEGLAIYKGFLEHGQGLILITGPTGSGKTSTLYTSLLQKRSETVNLVTIEDPIEYRLAGINQMQVNIKTKLTFANGLRSILRQDPDIIMVGEIRDTDTASIVFQSALTGHLVFSTLHTNDSVSAVTRLIDLGIEPYLIASATVGIVAQRLVRRICPHCREEYVADGAVRASLRLAPGVEPLKLARGKGCASCHETGYQGREAFLEILPITEDMREGILARKTEPELKRIAQSHGVVPLAQSGLQKVLAGITTPEELLRVIKL